MKFRSIQVFFVVMAGLSMLVVSVILLSINYYTNRQSSSFIRSSTNSIVSDSVRQELMALGALNANDIESSLSFPLTIADSLALLNTTAVNENADRQLTSLSRESLFLLIKATLLNNPSLLATYIGWEPNAFGSNDRMYSGRTDKGYDGSGRFMPSWYRGENNEALLMSLPTIESQVRLKTGVREGEYYLCAKEALKPCIIDPALYQLDDGRKIMLASFTVPIIVKGVFQGIAGADYSLGFIQKQLLETNSKLYGGSGAVFLISKNGSIVANTENSASLGESAKSIFSPRYLSILQSALGGASNYEVDDANNEIRLAIPVSIPEAGTKWSLLIKLPLDTVMSRAIEFQSEMVENARQGLIFMAFAGAVVTLGGLTLLWIMSFSVGQPLRHVAARLADIAEGEGDLTKELSTDRADEIGAIGVGFNTFLSKLRQTISNTVELTNRIGDASQRTLLISSNTDREVKQQLTAIELIATATQEMSATAYEVAHNASKASNAASDADISAKLGQKAVQESSQSTKILQVEMRRALQLVRLLESDSEDINKILSTIRSIAEQTNLLALNAAIEAARAGDQGRGFAVVADEVRNLAIKTQLSTSEIYLMIEKLNNGTREVVSAMERSEKCTEDSVRNSEQAADVLILITESVSLISEMNLQIASAAEEQSSVAEDISRNIVNISDSAASVARGAENTASASHALTELSSEQLSLVQQFKF